MYVYCKGFGKGEQGGLYTVRDLVKGEGEGVRIL